MIHSSVKCMVLNLYILKGIDDIRSAILQEAKQFPMPGDFSLSTNNSLVSYYAIYTNIITQNSELIITKNEFVASYSEMNLDKRKEDIERDITCLHYLVNTIFY